MSHREGVISTTGQKGRSSERNPEICRGNGTGSLERCPQETKPPGQEPVRTVQPGWGEREKYQVLLSQCGALTGKD